MTTPTTNFGWAKPVVGADSSTWGTELNTIVDAQDTVIGAVLTATGNKLTPTQVALTGTGVSAAAWTTNGIRAKFTGATYTDTSSSGTVANVFVDAFLAPTIAASSSTTYTGAYTCYFKDPVAGTNVTFSNKYALGADSLGISGNAVVGGTLGVTGAVTLSGAATLSGAVSGRLVIGSTKALTVSNSMTLVSSSGDGKTLDAGDGPSLSQNIGTVSLNSGVAATVVALGSLSAGTYIVHLVSVNNVNAACIVLVDHTSGGNNYLILVQGDALGGTFSISSTNLQFSAAHTSTPTVKYTRVN